jgi:TadE-like protein
MLLLLTAIIQFSLIFWAQNTLTQVVRDTGRWAATQQTPCISIPSGGSVVTKANELALTEALFGYTSGQWSGNGYTYNVSPAPREGVEVGWLNPDPSTLDPAVDCPPDSNATAWFLNIRAHHEVPLFFPLIGNFIPSCDADSCTLSSAVQFRMEPAP